MARKPYVEATVKEPEKLSGRERRRLGLGPQPKQPRPKRIPKPTAPQQPAPLPIGDRDAGAIVQRAVSFVEVGNFPSAAWSLAGGSRETWKRYVRRHKLYQHFGNRGDEPYHRIVETLYEASKRHEDRLLKTITKIAVEKKDGATLLKLQERRHDAWNLKTKVEVVHTDVAVLLIAIVEEECGADAAERISRRIERALAGGEGLPGEAGGRPSAGTG